MIMENDIPKKENKIPNLRTLKSDSSEYIKKKNISMLDMVATESKRKISRAAAGKTGKKAKNIMVKIFILLLFLMSLSAAGTAGYLIVKQKIKKEPPVSIFPNPIINPDSEKEITVKEISQIMGEEIPDGELRYFPIVKKTEGGFKSLATTIDFFKGIGVTAPTGLLDSLGGKIYLFIFSSSSNEPVIVFNVRSYENAFVAMMRWEENIFSDLGGALGIKRDRAEKEAFKDIEIENRDARELIGENGDKILTYSFIGRKYLVISFGEKAMKEIFRRFSSPRYLNE